jgi:ATP-dependent 26S proteasome regulatory subunit
LVGTPQRADYPELIGVHLRDTTLADGIDLSIIAASLPDKLSGADVAGFVTEVKQQAVQRNLKSEDHDIEDFNIVDADFGAVLSLPQWKTDQKPRNGAEIPIEFSP